jgi:transglutaminase-like putative cysteine protease
MTTVKLILPALFALNSALFLGDPKYPVKEIPEALLKNVDAVVRENTASFQITARDKATYHVHKVITILNDQGKSYATEVVRYDKLTKIRDFKASAYDQAGELLKRLKSSEFYDQSAYDGITLYSDNRLKAANVSQGRYPYTVEFEYDIEFKYLFQIPPFPLVSDEKVSVQRAGYTIEYPPALKPKFRLINIDQQPSIKTTDKGTNMMTWAFENISPVTEEPYGPPSESFYPQILAAPSEFEYDDYVGSMNSWDEFGKWIASLNKGRDELPESTRQKLQSLTAGLTTTEQKAKAVYQYLQSKTRYVSIQLGIGGFQPFEASVVDETGYGDCKALSNYMVSLLKAVGIKAYYALIHAGPDAPEMKTDFVCSQFNHAVVAVPDGADTLWLECTSQTNPFGYAGRFTGGRKALLITESGARIANTPVYGAGQNLQASNADVVIDLTGNAHARVTTAYHGLQYENGHLNAIVNDQYDEQKKWVLQNTQIPSFDLVSFKVESTKSKLPTAKVNLELSLNHFATVSGKRIFLTPNLLNRSAYVPEPLEHRKTNVFKRFAYTDIDTIRYQLPEQIYPEFLPKDVKITSQFGEYEATFKVDNGNLTYTRKVVMNKGKFPPESYQELIDFYRGISKADNMKMVFMNKT